MCPKDFRASALLVRQLSVVHEEESMTVSGKEFQVVFRGHLGWNIFRAVKQPKLFSFEFDGNPMLLVEVDNHSQGILVVDPARRCA